jgi:RNA polymerase sigma factor (sigma-70 family)
MDAQPKSRRSVNRQRNAELLREVVGQSEHLLRRQARQHAQLLDDAEDALQFAYLRFIERYRGDCEPLAWLYTTVKREAWAMRRKASRQRELSIDGSIDGTRSEAPVAMAATVGADELAVRAEQLTERKRMLGQLKPDERRALLLFACGCSYREICQLTGWTYTKVNRCMAEGRAALRAIWGA